MKINLSFFSLLVLVLAIGLVSCEGDMGEQGDPGITGPTGPTGPEGPEGMGFQDCIACHQSQNISAKVFQWEHSVHATGGNFERNQASCAACHTSQGFLDRIASGSMAASADVEDPLPQNCYTCHQIHSTFTEADWAFTATDPVTFWEGGETVDLGKSNLCINCHQARTTSPALPDPATGGTITITNKRYGPHHGAQGMMLTGSGAYTVGTGYVNSAHGNTNLNENGCVTCHMASAQAVESGGHTFRVSNEDGDLNYAGCLECHADEDEVDALVLTARADIDGLLSDLETKLIDLGLLGTDGYAIVPQEFTEHQAGALYNYQYVKEDNSRGIHNYKFAKKLLENSIAALN
jgi:formate-dependent nitrite reductase cytochrome c552 subunit